MQFPAISSRHFLLLSILVLALFIISEPALANRLTNIGSGLTGDHRVKMRFIKQYAFYFGILFMVLGAVTVIFRKRKFALQKRNDTNPAMGPFIMVVGGLLMIPYLFF